VPELDLDELVARLGPLGVVDVVPMPGGASSLTFGGRREGRRVVVKVAPPGVPPVLHRDVLRQARMLRILQPTPVPVPEVLAEEPGAPPAIPPLFVMSFVEGEAMEPLFDLEETGTDPAVVRPRLEGATTVLADLHRVEPVALGLGDEPRSGAEQEIDRWSRLLETVDQSLVARWEAVADTLRSSLPAEGGPSIVHGDFRLGNLLARGEVIEAVVDWEIWSVGDPRVDLGWFLLNADPHTYGRPTPYVGSTPPPEELAAAYADAAGHAARDISWFVALAAFKSAATWSLIVKHNRRRSRPDPDLDAMAPVLSRLLERARALLD